MVMKRPKLPSVRQMIREEKREMRAAGWSYVSMHRSMRTANQAAKRELKRQLRKQVRLPQVKLNRLSKRHKTVLLFKKER